MVDNENQWEDIEYSEGIDADDYGVSDLDADEYSEQEYSEQEGYDEYEEEFEDEEDAPKKSGSPIFLLLVLIILIGVGVFVFMNKQKGEEVVQEQPAQEVVATQTVDSTEMGDYFFNEANGGSEEMMSVNFDENGSTNVVTQSEQGEVVANVTETPSENAEVNLNGEEENAIMVSYTRPVRLNPFKPTDVDPSKERGTIANDTGFEIVEPPVSSVADENLTKLLQTQISGILYDEDSPSAIVNLNGVDQFVKVGDNVGGYLIEGISRNQVQISYNNNTYVASVGELFTKGVLENRQAVVNLENKFAGRNRNK